MKADQLTDGSIFIEFDLKAGNRLADAVIKHATHMPSAALDLSSILRKAKYETGSTFRQPPGAWEPGARNPRVRSRGG
ncbi:MAG: hypothetical protein KGJ12_07980 [Gammaproteobacteria bacterium]|nr:hypothetical protein [Gammaproteobacteria bacterium]